MVLKTCSKCGEDKSIEFFKKDSKAKTGVKGYCKQCAAVNAKAWYEGNIEKAKLSRKAYRQANIDKTRADNREHYEKNKDAYIARSKEYRLNNPETVKALRSAWVAANREKIAAYKAVYSPVWRAANPEACRTYVQNRRARKLANGGRLSPGLAAKLFKLQRGKCACCRVSLDDGYHMDHVIPLALEGPNEDWNMQLLCGPCNLSKSAKHPVDFMQERGFLL